jgi:hypothetical protein
MSRWNQKDMDVYNFIVLEPKTREQIRDHFGSSRMTSIRRLIANAHIIERWESFHTLCDDFPHWRYRYYMSGVK